MKNYHLILVLFFVSCLTSFTQPLRQYGSIKGTITDSLSGEPAPGAIIIVIQNDMEIQTVTEYNGGYLVDGLQPGICSVRISSIGYQTVFIKNVEITAGIITRLDKKIRNEAYKYEDQAKEELKLGIVKIWVPGLIIRVDTGVPDSVTEALYKKYGFEIIYTGCDGIGANEHNAVIETYLEERNGKGWEERMEKEFDALEQEYKNKK